MHARTTPRPIPDAPLRRDAARRELPRHTVYAELARHRVGALACCAASIITALALAHGCGPSSAQSASDPQQHSAAQRQVDELVEALVPLPQDLTSDLLDQHFHRGQELLANAKAGGREVGLAALQRLREGAPQDEKGNPYQNVELGLLATAAYAAPEDARPLLDALITQYGAGMHLRTEALVYLSETQPAHTLELIEPWVTKARLNQTTPPPEFIVRAWITASDKLGRSPVPQLADIATNLYYDQTGRVFAVKALGRYKDPLGAQALQAIVIESTGDGYLRRMAAQALLESLSAEDACAVLRIVATREADLNMLQFLRDVLDKNCGQ